MSSYTIPGVWCDRCHRQAQATDGESTLTELRSTLKWAGWVRPRDALGLLDWCPTCATEGVS